MAYLFNIATQAYCPLTPHHTFGRLATSVNTHIDKPYVSKLHAAIEWNSQRWRIKNLGLNGTWVNGKLLSQGECIELAVNDLLHLAEQNDPGFLIVDLSPPVDMLWPLECTQAPNSIHPIYLSRYHLVPDAQTPESAIYFDEQAQQWFNEPLNHSDEQPRITLNNGDIIYINNQQWQFMPVQIVGPTEAHAYPAQTLTDLEFVFNLSLDEETTQLELQHQQQNIDLAVRSHHYLLLQLARHRAADAARGLDKKSQGWIYADQLATELGLDSTHMNIHIFRLRKQLADSLPNTLGQQCLLERRGGKIRFGCEKFKIYKGETLMNHSPLNQPEQANAG